MFSRRCLPAALAQPVPKWHLMICFCRVFQFPPQPKVVVFRCSSSTSVTLFCRRVISKGFFLFLFIIYHRKSSASTDRISPTAIRFPKEEKRKELSLVWFLFVFLFFLPLVCFMYMFFRHQQQQQRQEQQQINNKEKERTKQNA